MSDVYDGPNATTYVGLRATAMAQAEDALTLAQECVSLERTRDPVAVISAGDELVLQQAVADALAEFARVQSVYVLVDAAHTALEGVEEIRRAYLEASVAMAHAEDQVTTAQRKRSEFVKAPGHESVAPVVALCDRLRRFRLHVLNQPGQRSWELWEMHREALRLAGIADGLQTRVADCRSKSAHRDSAKVAQESLAAAAEISSSVQLERALASATEELTRAESEVEECEQSSRDLPLIAVRLNRLAAAIQLVHKSCEALDKIRRDADPVVRHSYPQE